MGSCEVKVILHRMKHILVLSTELVCGSGLLPVGTGLAGYPPNQGKVFRTILRRQGDEGVHTYRIPGLATTPQGTLIAVFDVRHENSGDLPGDIDIGMMRSTDDGKTWSDGRLLDPRPCAYSCLTVLKDGSIGVLYECGDTSAIETLTFARFPLIWAGEAKSKR
jgi:hypothetical protein